MSEQVPALVMRSVENARVHVDDGELDRAIKMMSSTDALCSRVAAPPTVHGLALRVLADAYVRKAERASERGEKGGGDVASGESGGGEGVASGESGGGEGEDAGEEIDYLARAKGALNKGIEVCKVHEGRAGMPSFMAADLAGRMGDLYAALGEIFREEKNYKDALRSLRMGLRKFEMLGAKEFVGATHNRVAFCYMDKEEWKDALLELQEAERISSGVEAESAILSTTLAYRGKCHAKLDDVKAARVAYEGALKYAMASGNEGVVREAENFLAETQDQSAIDDSAFL